MNNKNFEAYQKMAYRYLSTLPITKLRVLGRELQLRAPTALKKEVLIQEIIKAHSGITTPIRNARGAPIKKTFLEPEILTYLNALKEKTLDNPSIEIIPQKTEGILELNTETLTQVLLADSVYIKLTKEQKKHLHKLIDLF